VHQPVERERLEFRGLAAVLLVRAAFDLEVGLLAVARNQRIKREREEKKLHCGIQTGLAANEDNPPWATSMRDSFMLGLDLLGSLGDDADPDI
jgi:hypothetical protein